VPFARELDTEAVVKSRLFVDRRESTVNEAGDFLIPKKEGAISDDHIQGEIGEILMGKVRGRKSAEEITLFKSLGLAVEDLASANHIYKKAIEKGMGTQVELGGSRHQFSTHPSIDQRKIPPKEKQSANDSALLGVPLIPFFSPAVLLF
jgi:hypothetical protein